MGQFAHHRVCCNTGGTPFSKGKRIFARGLAGLVERVWKGKRMKPTSPKIILGAALGCLRDSVLARSLALLSQWRSGWRPMWQQRLEGYWCVRNHRRAWERSASPHKKVARSTAHLKCSYTSGHGWATNSRLKPLGSRKSLTQLPSQKHGGMTHTARALRWVNSSERRDKGGEVVGYNGMLVCGVLGTD